MTKAKTTRTRTAAPPVPPLTDPHLAALLSYLSVSDPGDEEAGDAQARLDAAARALLSRRPVGAVFSWLSPKVGELDVYTQIHALVAADAARSPDLAALCRTAADAMRDEGPADVPADAVAAAGTLYIDTSMLLGAAVMYHLLRGGA